MKPPKYPFLFTALSLLLAGAVHAAETPAPLAKGWLHWRGPQQNGTSTEKNLPDKLTADHPLWTADLGGQSTPVVANGKLYILGFDGEGPDLQELIAAYDAETGQKLWEHRFNDFLSDIIYTRYSTSNPTVDAETGNVYMQGSQGILACFTADGKMVWRHSMMELFGRMTFPNGRTSTPLVDGDLVVTHGITANWGGNGPAADRFYAFDKKTGDLAWFCTPGARPKDSSYAPPTVSWWQGQRVMYCGTGDGSVVCVNARTGLPLWRSQITRGGVNTQVLVHNNDKLIVIHGSENLDNSEIGRMVALKIPTTLPKGTNAPGEPVVLPVETQELWRNELSAFTSSPILVGDTVYQVAETGDLCAVDARTGKVQWKLKIGIEQRNCSLFYGDGKLYVPILEDPEVKGKGGFYVVKPTEKGGEILSHLQLDGRFFGSPVAYNGKVYFQTTRRLFCFGKAGNNPGLAAEAPAEPWPAPGPAAELQVIPAEVLLFPGQTDKFRVRKLDAKGIAIEDVAPQNVKWASYIPPTARVKAKMNASFSPNGEIVAAPEPIPSAGAFEASVDQLKGYLRGRVLPNLPIQNDFEKIVIDTPHATETGTMFAYPPLSWIGARFKFEIREREGNKVLAKTIDNKLFQRAYVFIGHPEMKNYSVEADVLSDGARRKMSEVGVINQRYCIVLKGNSQELEVNSNFERVKVAVPFKWAPNVWYRLKTRVDLTPDGAGVVRGKAWKKGEPEPEAWTIEVPHRHAHENGAPGLFGFSPQDMRVYLDNIIVSKNN